jgi:hypothetical protein
MLADWKPGCYYDGATTAWDEGTDSQNARSV